MFSNTQELKGESLQPGHLVLKSATLCGHTKRIFITIVTRENFFSSLICSSWEKSE